MDRDALFPVPLLAMSSAGQEIQWLLDSFSPRHAACLGPARVMNEWISRFFDQLLNSQVLPYMDACWMGCKARKQVLFWISRLLT